jgi:hypothetical protein
MTVSGLRRSFSGEDAWRTVAPKDLNNVEWVEWPEVIAQGQQKFARYERIIPRVTNSELDMALQFANGEPELKAARKLHVEDPMEVSLAALALWDHSLSQEREERVAALVPAPTTHPRKLQALRGWVTRELIRELEPIVRKADG